MEKIRYDFKDRTAVITGGAQGFGLDIAKRFLKSGAKVIIWDIDPVMLEKAIKDLNSPNLSSNVVDVSLDKFSGLFKTCASNLLEVSRISSSSLDTRTLSMYLLFFPASILQAIRGLPQRSSKFLRGSLLLPPLAGIIARNVLLFNMD